MRKISANLILPVSSPPLKNGIISLDDEGRIRELSDTGGNLREEHGLEFYNGIIVPGFILPWMRLDEAGFGGGPETSEYPPESQEHAAEIMHRLDQDLLLKGIKAVGLVISESIVSDGGFKRMAGSDLIYHPVIELCPEPDEDEFEVFNRGIDLVSRAWNEYKLSCSLTVCSPAMKKGDTGKYLREYNSSHENVSAPEQGIPRLIYPSKASLNILKIMQASHPRKSIKELLPGFTLESAVNIFENDVLGSIEVGKKPGLNLISGLDPESLRITEKSSLKVLL